MKNLKTLREARGLSQQKLAEQFSLSQQSIYKYENDLAEPDFSTLKEFADFFHTSIDYLIDYNQNSEKIDITLSVETLSEAHHLEMYRKLTQTAKEKLDAFLEALTEETNN